MEADGRPDESRTRARVLALLLGLMAGAHLLAAAGFQLRPTPGSTAARDLGVSAAVLLLTAAVVARRPLASRATNLTLALAVGFWAAASAHAALPLLLRRWSSVLEGGQVVGGLVIEDARLGHRLAPLRTAPYRTNADGFRGPALPPRQSDDELRIVAIGDSITFGWLQYADNATYPAALEQELRRRQPGRRIHVLNAGVPSYASVQALRLVSDRIAEWQPDLLIVCVGWNDLSFGYEPHWSPLAPVDPSFERAVSLFGPLPGDVQAALDPRAPLELRRNLEAIVALARRHAVAVLLLNLPTVMSPARTAREQQLAGRVAGVDLRAFDDAIGAVCDTGVPCFQQAFPFEESGKEAWFVDHCHLNAAGGQELARRLADVVLR